MLQRILSPRVVVLAAVAAVASAAVYGIGTQLRGDGTAHYEPSTWLVVAAAIAGAAVVFGLRVAAAGPIATAVLAAITSFALGFGLIAIFSIGLPAVLIGLVLSAYLIRRGRSDPAIRPAIQGGVAIGLALWVVVMAALQAPVVKCETGGAQIMSGGGPGGSVEVSADGRTTTGMIRLDSASAQFRCQDGRLVEYRVQ